MKHLGLFEGIGGFSLAASWAGWHTPVMVEWNQYCKAVLKKNFPNATIFGDIHEFDGQPYAGQIDIITGGFPCQPYSHAGVRAGNDDNRALWPQMLRVIREVGPRWVVGENVAGILSMDGGRVLAGILADLENAGYSPEIYSIPAVGVGAPHERERIWIIAHRNDFCRDGCGQTRGRRAEFTDQNSGIVAHPHAGTSAVPIFAPYGRNEIKNTDTSGQNSGVTSDADLQRCGQRHAPAKPGFAGFYTGSVNQNAIKNPGCEYGKMYGLWPETEDEERVANEHGHANSRHVWAEHWLPTATRLCRVDDGIPAGLDGTGNIPATPAKKRTPAGKSHRIEALGNAIVPEIAYQIFQAINEYEAQQ